MISELVLAVGLVSAGLSEQCGHPVPKRSAQAIRQFKQITGYPRGRRGYVVDHVCPLSCGGADSPRNMQWQPVAEAKEKDKIERTDLGYAQYCRSG